MRKKERKYHKLCRRSRGDHQEAYERTTCGA